jgi:hypothetical protein
VAFPTGFLISTPKVSDCLTNGEVEAYPILVRPLTTCSVYFYYVGGSLQSGGSFLLSIYMSGIGAGYLPAGNTSLVITGLTLSETPVVSTNTFKVFTDLDTCSTPAATGAIGSACPQGEYNPVSTDVKDCVKCPAGTAGSKASTCTKCPAGTFSSELGQLKCTLCPAGSFSARVGLTSQSSCDFCAAGFFSVVAGATAASTCMRCSPGTGSAPGASKCNTCEAGTWSDSGFCFDCPGSSYSLLAGSRSVGDCTGVFLRIGGTNAVYVTGLIIFLLYIASFTMVPSWTAADTIMHFEFTADFEGRIKTGRAKSSRTAAESDRRDSWLEMTKKRFSSSANEVQEKEKRFFATGDTLVWEREPARVVIGTVESTSVYPEQDPDEIGDFVVFVNVDSKFMSSTAEGFDLPSLKSALKSDSKPIFSVAGLARSQTCYCQLQSEPSSHAYAPVFKFTLGRWELMRQLNACFQLLLLSMFPAIDTISDLLFVMSSVFANFWLFGLALFFLTSQFWLYVLRLKKRRVFEAFMQRRVEMPFLRSLSWWPKWAQPDSIIVFVVIIVPFYIMFWVVFPVVWFFIGYALYSFQLFPISRISNRWLYLFVYSFSKQTDSKRKRFDSSNAIILPMVQKGKLEEALLEAIPQMIIQILNTWLIGGSVPVLTYFSISLSVLSLLNTVWYYGYWNIFRCSRIRDIPSDLALYNYKLSGVKDGPLSFSKQSDDVAAMELNFMASVTVDGVARDVSLNERACSVSIDFEDEVDLPKRQHAPNAVMIELQQENQRLKDMVEQLRSRNDELCEQLATHINSSKEAIPRANAHKAFGGCGIPDVASGDTSLHDLSAAAQQSTIPSAAETVEPDASTAALLLLAFENGPQCGDEDEGSVTGARPPVEDDGALPSVAAAASGLQRFSFSSECPEESGTESAAPPVSGCAELASPIVPSAELQLPAGGSMAETAVLRLQSAYRRHRTRASMGKDAMLQPPQQAFVGIKGDT